jgi:multicomponent K+:H+ antiporter subunit A
MALLITGTGGLCRSASSSSAISSGYDLDAVLAAGDAPFHIALRSRALLIFMGALTKSAQFPSTSGCNATAAPTPASAYLHSATMVKAGVFLLVRFWPVLSGTDEWFFILGLAGMCTLVLGAYFAIFQQDLKGLLAYSTISHLGLITMLLSFGSPLAAVAAIFHMMNHATFKASLFMAAGIIDHEAGTRDMRRLSGLFSHLPITATLAMVASAAMAGVPLLNGFLSKEMFFAQAVETHRVSLPTVRTPMSPPSPGVRRHLFQAPSTRFLRAEACGPAACAARAAALDAGSIELLVFACLFVGIFPVFLIFPYLRVAAVSVLGVRTPVYSGAVLHGFNYPLLMSVIAMVAGLILYVLLRRYLERCDEGPPGLRRLKGQRIFERILGTVCWSWARWVATHLGTRRLQQQLRLLVAAGSSPRSADPADWPRAAAAPPPASIPSLR